MPIRGLSSVMAWTMTVMELWMRVIQVEVKTVRWIMVYRDAALWASASVRRGVFGVGRFISLRRRSATV